MREQLLALPADGVSSFGGPVGFDGFDDTNEVAGDEVDTQPNNEHGLAWRLAVTALAEQGRPLSYRLAGRVDITWLPWSTGLIPTGEPESQVDGTWLTPVMRVSLPDLTRSRASSSLVAGTRRAATQLITATTEAERYEAIITEAPALQIETWKRLTWPEGERPSSAVLRGYRVYQEIQNGSDASAVSLQAFDDVPHQWITPHGVLGGAALYMLRRPTEGQAANESPDPAHGAIVTALQAAQALESQS